MAGKLGSRRAPCSRRSGRLEVKTLQAFRPIAIACALLLLGATACKEATGVDNPITTGVDDHEFDFASGITARELTTIQVQNLALLAKTWGFAKYHHPRVAGGQVNWDYELFRAVPTVLAAPDRAAASAAIVTWLDRLGNIPGCGPCASAPTGAQLAPDNAWTLDVASLGQPLRDRLRSMYTNRPTGSAQRYVTFFPNVGNPDFTVESNYSHLPSPDAGYRLLALSRLWNIIRYWFPYRDAITEDWDSVLLEFIPVMMRDMSGDAYRLALIRLIARVTDTHANIWSDLRVQPPTGTSEAPLILRFVENRLLVTGYSHTTLGPATGLKVGDEIQSIGGISVATLVDSLRPFYPASNEPTRLRDMAKNITRGSGQVTLAGSGATGAFSVAVDRAPLSSLNKGRAYMNDLPGATFRMLADSVAYLKLSSVVSASAGSYIDQARDAKVLVIDIRNYPSEFVVFSLGGYLVPSALPFARFTTGSAANPGAFTMGATASHSPRTPRFGGTVVILVDEMTQSQAEYTSMAFRVSPGALVVGSTTAGADGNISRIPLPGGAEGMISGIGVFYPDGRATQRIGIVPDLVVRATVEGIRAGRDEVLEAGVTRALGREFRLP
jgi:C-terminal processing protease CtpA/Prc